MAGEAAQIIESLATRHRVIVLGGLAVIAHGLSRTTRDSDIWLEPFDDISRWCEIVRNATANFPAKYFFDVSMQSIIESGGLEQTIDNAGMVRIGGLDRYLDIFYQPNQLDLEDFDAAWSQTELGLGSARVMDESFLIATKVDTGRITDQDDISFLEKKLRSEFSARLEACSLPEAQKLFSRYLDHATCQAAVRNPDPAVQALGLGGLRELAEGGNPFAIEALKRLT